MGPTAVIPWPLVSKPKAASGAGDVEATMPVDAASATVRVARRMNSISRGISESSPRISRNNSSISRRTSESSPRISSGSSNISDGNRNSSTSGISRGISRSSPHRIQGDGVHHAFVSGGVVNTGILCQSAVQYPPRVFLTRTRARKLLLIHILETKPIFGAGLLHHHNHPPRRWTSMDRPFCPSRPRAPSPNSPPPGAICVTRQVARTECKRRRECYYTWLLPTQCVHSAVGQQ